MPLRPLLASMILLSAVGCARLATQPSEPSKLPPARMSPDSVVLEVAFVRLPALDRAAYDAIWDQADEQHFPAELRRELGVNGLRAGVLGQQIPAELRELLDAAPNALEERSEDVTTSDVEVNRAPRRLQCRSGRRAKIIVSKTHSFLALLLNEQQQVRGHALTDAQCLLALKAYPQGNGRVKLDITPEVEHGQHRTEWVGSEGSLMQRVGRDKLVVDRLRMDALLAPGQTLVISNTAEIKGLGEYYFAETAGGATERTLLLVRVAQTQIDDLFTPDSVLTPLVTPGE
ncbi:MAG TPA: hypothetical protein VFV87_21785 [Pirellulaceae bacterium]|nr:hypothetical protein [Pirellulaceae bacterium]